MQAFVGCPPGEHRAFGVPVPDHQVALARRAREVTRGGRQRHVDDRVGVAVRTHLSRALVRLAGELEQLGVRGD